jgi:ABC-type antimicrobial peptide transport system permease subunit
MFRNYLLVALRNIARHKLYSFINIAGLAVGLACVVLDRDVVLLLLWQFSIPVLIANLIAWPLAWYYLQHWLQGFAYRITLSPLYFLAMGLAALLIAWATILGHALRVARANPIHALRYE